LLLLPISRNNIWSIVFGVSWERLIKYHQYLAGVLFASVLVHMFLWWKRFDEYDSFPHDILAIPTEFHADNFTIPFMMITFIAMIILIGGGAQYIIRRNHFELFYWAHHIFLIFFIAMLWHATMAWYYILGGLVLWIIDGIIRLQSSLQHNVIVHECKQMTTDVTLLSYTIHPSSLFIAPSTLSFSSFISQFMNTSLPLRAPGIETLEGSPLQCKMGQYVFINIPEISPWEWHPFTLSSAPCDEVSTHHIKRRNSTRSTQTWPASDGEQWTDKLYSLAGQPMNQHDSEHKQVDPNHYNSMFHMYIEGPYGTPIDIEKYSHFLMIGGGIGITPLHSCFRQLYYDSLDNLGSQEGSYTSHVRSVRLIWVMKHKKDAMIFNHMFATVQRDNVRGKFTIELYYTVSSDESELLSHNDLITDSYSISQRGREREREKLINKTDVSKPSLIESLTRTLTATEKQIQFGRPDLNEEIMRLQPVRHDSILFVCGPHSLVSDCSDICMRENIEFKYESFEL